jgi:hypothetical protein
MKILGDVKFELERTGLGDAKIFGRTMSGDIGYDLGRMGLGSINPTLRCGRQSSGNVRQMGRTVPVARFVRR